MKTTPYTRRSFLRNTGLATGLLGLGWRSAVLGANERIRLGFIGVGGRGINLAKGFGREEDVEIVWLCDADGRRLPRAEAALEPTPKRPPRLTRDLRNVLDDPEVDAVVVATPDHWHGLATVLACQAGKDVYVEKPLSHNLKEGQSMIKAARRHDRVVQVGIQSRSAPYVAEAVEYLDSGKLGDVRWVKVFNQMEHSAAPMGSARPVPDKLDWDLWCGPAQLLPYRPDRRWLNFREFSCGPIAGDAIHQLDLARLLMGDPLPPEEFSHQGGIEVLTDGRDLPDSQLAIYRYPNFTLLFQASLWTPYQKKTPMDLRDRDVFPNWPFSSTRIEILGTRGGLYLGRHGGGWQAYDADGQIVAEAHGRQADVLHKRNWLDCIRSRQKPTADVAQGHQSTLLCHLALAAWQAGDGTFQFDGKKEKFVDSGQANRFLGRDYREPWEFPPDA